MPILPHFSRGKFGKVTAEVLNTLVDAVNSNSSQIELLGTSQPQTGVPLFPIYARITAAITNDDGVVKGYKWEEKASLSNGQPTSGSRKYNDEIVEGSVGDDGRGGTEIGPVAHPIGGPENTACVGQYVWLHPANFEDTGKAYLLFQNNRVAPDNFIGQIIQEGGGAAPYILAEVAAEQADQVPGSDLVLTGRTFQGINGADYDNNILPGGFISGTGDCDPIITRAPVPAGYLVVCQTVLDASTGDFFVIFNHQNDFNVTCNCESGLMNDVSENQEGYSSSREGTPQDPDDTYNISAERAMQ